MRSFKILSAIRGLLKNKRGSVAVEFAFLFPVHVALVLAIVDIGIMEFAATELQGATSSAVRQIRTGAVQQAPIPSTPAQNGLGITIDTGDTTADIFHKLLCSQVLEDPTAYGNSTASGLVINCNNIVFDIRSYATFTEMAAAGLGQLVYVDGTPNVEFSNGVAVGTGFNPGSSNQVIAARVWYQRDFMIPYIARMVGGSTQGVTLTSTVVIKAEPW